MPNRNQQGKAERYANKIWDHIAFIEEFRRQRERDRNSHDQDCDYHRGSSFDSWPSHSLSRPHCEEPTTAFGYHCTRCGEYMGSTTGWQCFCQGAASEQERE